MSGLTARQQSQSDTVPISAAELNEIRAKLAELEGKRAEVEAWKKVAGAKDEQIKALEAIIASQERLVAKWEEAASSRAGANGLEDQIRKQYEELAKRYDDEIGKLRSERDKAVAAGNRKGIFGFVLGIAVTIAVVVASRSGG